MARKGLFGKLFTVVASAAAILGTCYIFRDKIKESRLYEKLDLDDKLQSLKNMLKKEEDEEDFFEEDEYIFNTAEDDSNRTYVSLNPESAAVTESTEDTDTEEPAEDADTEESAEDADTEESAEDADTEEPAENADTEEATAKYTETQLKENKKSEETKNAGKDTIVPTIALDTHSDVTTASENSFTTADASADLTSSEEKSDTPSGYDMEGLSDVSEDPDVLMEQDLLDESPFEFY